MSNLYKILCLLVMLLWCTMAQSQTFTGNRGFPVTLRGDSDTPTPIADLSIQIPGAVELNDCIRFVQASGDVCICLDDATQQLFSETDCDNSYDVGTDFFLGSGTGGVSKNITDAVDEASAFCVGDGTNKVCFWSGGGAIHQKATIGGNPAPIQLVVPSGESLSILDAALSFGIIFDDTLTAALSGTAKETYSPWFDASSFSTDGTLCTAVQDYTINGFKTAGVGCADNDSSTITTKFGLPDRWDTGTLRVMVRVVNIQTTPAGDFELQWAMASGGNIDGTFGTEQVTLFDFDASGSCGGSACVQNQEVVVLSAAITPEGTPTRGDLLRIRGQVGATNTTVTTPETNVIILGFNLLWTADKWTD